MIGCTYGQVTQSAGRLMICISNNWYTVCSYTSWPWTNATAQVVCRQLGYSTDGW